MRHLIGLEKVQASDTGWRREDMPPRACPINSKTRPIKADWQWRSAKAFHDEMEFTLVAEANAARANWKSFLILETDGGFSVVGRFEFHGSHPGQHLHSDCNTSGIKVGAESMDPIGRIPPALTYHRRSAALTPSLFWQSARSFFRIRDNMGPLFERGD